MSQKVAEKNKIQSVDDLRQAVLRSLDDSQTRFNDHQGDNKRVSKCFGFVARLVPAHRCIEESLRGLVASHFYDSTRNLPNALYFTC